MNNGDKDKLQDLIFKLERRSFDMGHSPFATKKDREAYGDAQRKCDTIRAKIFTLIDNMGSEDARLKKGMYYCPKHGGYGFMSDCVDCKNLDNMDNNNE